MTADDAITDLEIAFAGVTLGSGTSLRQAELLDDMSAPAPKDSHWDFVRESDVIDDWRHIPHRDLEELPYLAHVDALGFRYYIPALLSHVARSYDPIWNHVAQTLHALCALRDDSRYYRDRFAVFTVDQNRAIAVFLSRLPDVVALSDDDRQLVSEGVQRYWAQFLRYEKNA